MFDFKKILDQAKQIGEKSQKVKEELEKIEIEGRAGGDFVIIKGTASGKINLVNISDELFTLNDKTMLEQMIKGAMIDFLNQQKEKVSEISKKQLENLELPPIFDSFLDSMKDIN
ncbi:MAG: YbaB/EbfC family nucleoid-associated protein [Exilispira sp.]|jgi:DNA-binding YbaB/EbfC family protein|nr:YbaB/EbfC family nucleoid-associated protein [Exilispira sp.]